jgi:hypothetical protein
MLATVQGMVLASLKEYLGARKIRESSVHEIQDRAHAFLGGAHGAAEHGGFRQRRIDNSVDAEFVAKIFRMWERTCLNANTEQEHILVTAHFFNIGFPDRFAKGDFAFVIHYLILVDGYAA